MSVILAWVLFPLVFVAVCGGLGLLVERASGGVLPGVLILPLGAAALITASQLTTFFDWTAELTTPFVVVLSLAGFVLGYARLRGFALDWWAAAAAFGVFAILAAPVILSGQATFAGYTVLGDTSIQMIGADQLPETGRDFDSLAPSSYEMSLVRYYDDSAYPSGGPTALATLRSLVFDDVAWIYQPFLACLVAMLALALYSLAGIVISWPLLRGLAAFVAAQPALVVGYAFQGSIKEVGIVFVVTLIGALVSPFAGFPAEGYRRGVPIVVAGASAIALVGPAAAVWLVPFAVGLIVIALRRAPHGRKALAGVEIAAMGVLLAVLAYPSLLQLGSFLGADTFLTSPQEFGNLLGPLKTIQMFGIWFEGDYRMPPLGSSLTWTDALIGVVIASLVLGLLWAIRRREARLLLLFLGVSVLAWAYVMWKGSPWADGKALMIVSPAVMLAAMLGPAAFSAWGRRLEALILAGVIAGGVLVSSAFAYHDVSLAPRDRLAELAQIGKDVDGRGPTLYTEFEEFGKHFLRDGAPEGSSEGWQRRYAPLRNGQYVRQGYTYDLDEFPLDYVRYYRTIVVRKSPVSSRPPSNYRLILSTKYYDVWQRGPNDERSVLAHMPLGSRWQRGGRAPCEEVMRLAGVARRAGGDLAYVPAPRSFAIFPAKSAFPPGWFVDPTEGFVLRPRGPGKVEDSTVVSAPPGTYDLWIEGSFGRGYDVWLDGRRVGHLERQLNGRDLFGHVTSLYLQPGQHTVTLFRGGGSLEPGDGLLEMLGPILLTQRPAGSEVRHVDPAKASSLCGRWLDWVEAVRA
jgi:energy-converting hydrogenase Eha subunit E